MSRLSDKGRAAIVAAQKKRWAKLTPRGRRIKMRRLAREGAKNMTAQARRERAAKGGAATKGKPRGPGAGRPKKNAHTVSVRPHKAILDAAAPG